MMAPQTQTETLLLVVYSFLFILSLQTSLANPYCAPSVCGIIDNIGYPFRLTGDPNYCGDPSYELACESNVTFLYLNSHKYYVKAINYATIPTTIRVVDASISINDPCSFPTYSAYAYNFTSLIPYTVPRSTTSPYGYAPWHITLISCPHPHLLKNSSFFTDITHHCHTSNSSNPRFTYIKVGTMKASDVTESCSVDKIVMTSWEFKNPNDLSLQQIHRSLLYGFELRFCMNCRSSPTAWDKFRIFLYTRLSIPFEILLLIVVVSGALVISPVMSIIGVTLVLVFLFSIANYLYNAVLSIGGGGSLHISLKFYT